MVDRYAFYSGSLIKVAGTGHIEGVFVAGADYAALEKRIKVLEDALRGLLSKFPNEKTDYSGVGWCAGCGALHWCSGNPGKPEPCKPHCVLQAAIKAMEVKP